MSAAASFIMQEKVVAVRSEVWGESVRTVSVPWFRAPGYDVISGQQDWKDEESSGRKTAKAQRHQTRKSWKVKSNPGEKLNVVNPVPVISCASPRWLRHMDSRLALAPDWKPRGAAIWDPLCHGNCLDFPIPWLLAPTVCSKKQGVS